MEIVLKRFEFLQVATLRATSKTTDPMFKYLLAHIKYGYAGVNSRTQEDVVPRSSNIPEWW